MPTFNIVKESDIRNSFRVSKVKTDFDLKTEKITEEFKGDIKLPEKWNVGLIVGNSGTGKSTIAKQLFGVTDKFEYTHSSVIDDMPKGCSVEDITKMFYSVGFGSVPSWLKPYHVLSNGEQMRVDIARALLSQDLTVFDEFTSVVDRNVAKTLCTAIEKAIRKTDKQFIGVSCHKDIIEYLQPDWVFDTDTMKTFFQSAHDQKGNLKYGNVGVKNGKSLGNITI